MSEYNIVFNSNNGTGNNNQKTYFFDWSMIPSGKYQVSFSYQGQVNKLTGGEIALVYMNLGQHNNFEVLPNGYTNGQYLGMVKPYILATASFLYADIGDNSSFTINDRPSQNNITISIFNNANPPVIYCEPEKRNRIYCRRYRDRCD